MLPDGPRGRVVNELAHDERELLGDECELGVGVGVDDNLGRATE